MKALQEARALFLLTDEVVRAVRRVNRVFDRTCLRSIDQILLKRRDVAVALVGEVVAVGGWKAVAHAHTHSGATNIGAGDAAACRSAQETLLCARARGIRKAAVS